MLNTILKYLGILQTLPADHIILYNDILLTVSFMGFFCIWLLAGDIVKVWIQAWWQRCEIALEWTKARSWKFHLAHREKGHDDFRTLPDGRPIEMRREAVGTGPHKVQMFTFTSEFGAIVSPTEIEGERYYVPTDFQEGYIFNDEFHPSIPLSQMEYERLAELTGRLDDKEYMENHQEEYEQLLNARNLWNQRKLYVRYPNSAVAPDEFVKFQTINTDPSTTESYSEYRELETKAEMMGTPFGDLLKSPYLLAILIALAIAYNIIGQQNIAASVNGQFMECTKDLGGCLAQCKEPIYQASKSIVNTTMGGVIQQ